MKVFILLLAIVSDGPTSPDAITWLGAYATHQECLMAKGKIDIGTHLKKYGIKSGVYLLHCRTKSTSYLKGDKVT